MCRRVQCESCGKPTYAGCGQHIEQVLADVPAEERCRCRDVKEGTKPVDTAGPSFVRRIFGG